MAVRLDRGPFRRFEGEWRLTELAADFTNPGSAMNSTVRSSVGSPAAYSTASRTPSSMRLRVVPNARPARRCCTSRTRQIQHQEEPHDRSSSVGSIAAFAPRRGAIGPTRQTSRSTSGLSRSRPDEVLVGEGTSDNHFYVIVRGSLGVVRNAGTPEQVTLLTLTAGDLVGELSFIDETPHYASLVAVGAHPSLRTGARTARGPARPPIPRSSIA